MWPFERYKGRRISRIIQPRVSPKHSSDSEDLAEHGLLSDHTSFYTTTPFQPESSPTSSTSPTAQPTSLPKQQKPLLSHLRTDPSSKAGNHHGVEHSNFTLSKRKAPTRKSVRLRPSEVQRWMSSGVIWCFSRFSREGVIILSRKWLLVMDGRGLESVAGTYLRMIRLQGSVS
jgi:hypothetical protein